MKTKIQNKIADLGNAIRNAVDAAEKKFRLPPHTAELQPAFAIAQNPSIFAQFKFVENGIPFSPLND